LPAHVRVADDYRYGYGDVTPGTRDRPLRCWTVTSRERLRPGLTATVWSMSETLRLTITYDEPDEEGWIVARVVEVPGALSQGRTREEAKENVLDALRLMLAPDDDDANVAAGRSEPLELTLTE
jgi:predicted RNase H-like HicB family nuclease